jgi:hypothetical protein
LTIDKTKETKSNLRKPTNKSSKGLTGNDLLSDIGAYKASEE